MRLNGARDPWSKLVAMLGSARRLTPVIGLERGLTDPITVNMGRPPNSLRISFTSRGGRPTNTPPKARTDWPARSSADT